MLTFHLWDPSDFNIYGKHNKNINRLDIHQDFFKDKDAIEYSKNDAKYIFMTDLRSSVKGDSKSSNEKIDEFEEGVEQNNSDQMKWVQTIKPEITSLKFRTPYLLDPNKSTKYRYLYGTVYLQIWQPIHSTETRLVVEKENILTTKIYDALEYEERLVYHNNIIREYKKFQIDK